MFPRHMAWIMTGAAGGQASLKACDWCWRMLDGCFPLPCRDHDIRVPITTCAISNVEQLFRPLPPTRTANDNPKPFASLRQKIFQASMLSAMAAGLVAWLPA